MITNVLPPFYASQCIWQFIIVIINLGLSVHSYYGQ